MNISEVTYTKIIKPFLFKFTEAEDIHEATLSLGHFFGKFAFTRFITKGIFAHENSMLSQEISGIKFKNPVGLSAGFDKNAEIVNLLPSLGFSFGQIGTITNYPYAGNEKPRLYRLPKSKSIVVNFGLKNDGVEKILKRIKESRHKSTILGISVGRTNCKETVAPEAGIKDISSCLSSVIESGLGDMYTINISCPNLFGGESFTAPDSLEKLLGAIYELPLQKPVYIKMPINLPWEEFGKLVDVAVSFKVDGVIIGNLNKVRKSPKIIDEIPEHIKGSASGMPTQALSNELISKTYKNYGDKLVIIGVGGIFCAEDAYEKIKRGASLVQLITGLIFEGPQLVGQINKGLVKLLKADDFEHIGEAIGANHK